MADTFKGIITADGKKRSFLTDDTLTKAGVPADSKAVGDKFKEVKAETDSLKEDISNIKGLRIRPLTLRNGIWLSDSGYGTSDSDMYAGLIKVGKGAKLYFKPYNDYKYVCNIYMYSDKYVSSYVEKLTEFQVNPTSETKTYVINSDGYIAIKIRKNPYEAITDIDNFNLQSTVTLVPYVEEETFINDTFYDNDVIKEFAYSHKYRDLNFALQTDTHYSAYYGSQSLSRIRDLPRLTKYAKFDFCANLGDLVDGHAHVPFTKSDILTALKAYDECDCPFLQVFGNHDENGWFASDMQNKTSNVFDELVLPKYWNRNVLLKRDTIAFDNEEVRYYSYDINGKGTRIICIDTHDVNYSTQISTGELFQYGFYKYVIRQKQIDWLVKCLQMPNVDFDKVIVLSHCSLADGETYGNAKVVNSDIVRGILEAFKNGTSYEATGTDSTYPCTVSVDFSSQGAKNVIGNFSGHLHADKISEINGIKYVQTDKACAYESDSEEKKLEDVIDSVTVEFSTKTVRIFRHGYGSYRQYTY